MKLYTVTLIGERVGLVAADTLREAKQEAAEANGRNNILSVTLATEEEIEWVRSMGGFVPTVETPDPWREVK